MADSQRIFSLFNTTSSSDDAPSAVIYGDCGETSSSNPFQADPAPTRSGQEINLPDISPVGGDLGVGEYYRPTDTARNNSGDERGRWTRMYNAITAARHPPAGESPAAVPARDPDAPQEDIPSISGGVEGGSARQWSLNPFRGMKIGWGVIGGRDSTQRPTGDAGTPAVGNKFIFLRHLPTLLLFQHFLSTFAL